MLFKLHRGLKVLLIKKTLLKGKVCLKYFLLNYLILNKLDQGKLNHLVNLK